MSRFRVRAIQTQARAKFLQTQSNSSVEGVTVKLKRHANACHSGEQLTTCPACGELAEKILALSGGTK